MILLVLFLLSFKNAYAAETSSSIFINEFLIEPTQQVEIVNNGTSTVDISGWFLDDNGGTTYYTVPDGTVVGANTCVVLSGSFNLNKTSSDAIRLFDKNSLPTSTSSSPVDEYTYSKSPGEGVSFQRTPDLSTTWLELPETLGRWNQSREGCTIVPTPTRTPTPTVTSTPSPTQKPLQNDISRVYISEFLPAPPSGEKEWVELYNDNDVPVTLTDWYIDDVKDGGASEKKFTLTIPAKRYGVVTLATAIFNNSGDSVRLLNMTKTELDSVQYGSSQIALSWGWSTLLDSTYCIQEPTPEEENGTCKSVGLTPTVPSVIPVSPLQENAMLRAESEGSQDSPHTLYHIAAQLPLQAPVTTQDVRGVSTSIPRVPDHAVHSISIPALGFSLLSILSIAAKMNA